MALYVIADLHLSLGTDKPMDVFKGWNNYVERLKENWEGLVKPEDSVVLAGDLSWAMKLEDAVTDFTFLHELPGKKFLMKGNHDYWWSTRKKIDEFFVQHGFYDMQILHNCAYRVGDISICGTRGWLYNSETAEDRKIVSREVGRLRASITEARALGGKPVVFLHYPPVFDNMECTEILDLLHEEEIEDCYFGHIHGQYAARRALVGEYQGVRMHLISCDFVNFMPVEVKTP